MKYIFTPDEDGRSVTKNEALPDGYHFGPIKDDDDHLNLVLSRTVIPRTLATLRQLGSVGVFYDGETYPTVQEYEAELHDHHTAAVRGTDTRSAREIELSTNVPDAMDLSKKLEKVNQQPVAWGFLGKDASLTSLHVESRHRGRGLAGAVTQKLFSMQTEVFSEGTTMGHADVFESNTPSRRVMEKLGGKNQWVVVWAEVDVQRILDGPKEGEKDIWGGAGSRWKE